MSIRTKNSGRSPKANTTVTPTMRNKPVIRLGKIGKLRPIDVRRAVSKVKRAHEARRDP